MTRPTPPYATNLEAVLADHRNGHAPDGGLPRTYVDTNGDDPYIPPHIEWGTDAPHPTYPTPPMRTVNLIDAAAHIDEVAAMEASHITAGSIECLIDTALECAALEAQIKAVRDRARDQLRRALEFAGLKDYVTPAGTAEMVEAYERVTYDRRALDTLCLDDPTLEARLAPHRKAVEVAATLRVSGPAKKTDAGPARDGGQS